MNAETPEERTRTAITRRNAANRRIAHASTRKGIVDLANRRIDPDETNARIAESEARTLQDLFEEELELDYCPTYDNPKTASGCGCTY